MEFSLLGAALVGAGSAAAALWLGRRRAAAPSARELGDLLLAAAAAGLVVGRVVEMVVGGTNPLAHPGDLLILRAGIHTGAAALAALAAAAFLARRNLPVTLDAAAPAALAGLAGWHAGCLVRGACLGTPTGLPWGVAQAGSDVARHPVEIYAALALLVAAGLLAWVTARRPPRGLVAGAAIAAAGAIRLATEPLRPGIGSGPEWWYAAGVAAGAAAALTAAALGRRRAGPATHQP